MKGKARGVQRSFTPVGNVIESEQPSPNKGPGPQGFSTAAKLQRATDLSNAHAGLIGKESRLHEKTSTQMTAWACC